MVSFFYNHLLALALVIFLSTGVLPALAEAPTGNELQQWCKEGSRSVMSWHSGICGGYIAGVSDMLVANGTICPGPNVNRRQIQDIVEQSLQTHPETRDQISAFLMKKSLGLAFPCKTN